MGQAQVINAPMPGQPPPPQVMKISNLQDVENAFNRLQYLATNISGAEAKMNEDIATLRSAKEKYIIPFDLEKEMLEKALETFAVKNRNNAEIFKGDAKSVDLRGGILSFRETPGAVEIKTSKIFKKIEDVIAAIGKTSWKKKLLKIPKPTLDKNAVKKFVDEGTLTSKMLASFGLYIKKEERFSYELKTAEKMPN